jgi:hypothetical protein
MNNTTPQRPQLQKRRQRHTTISEDTMTPILHISQSAPSMRPQRRTPQSHQRQAVKIQRQHSVSCSTPTGKLSPPQFVRYQKATNGGSQTSLFAGSKFMDSPAPEVIPLPPIHWFSTDLRSTGSRNSPTPSSASSISSTFEDAKSVSSDGSIGSSLSDQRGFRINPMQLIAAVAVSAVV